jgi:hypothetical protein
MPTYDVSQRLMTTKTVDGERKSFTTILGSQPCPSCGAEHGKPIEEDVTLGSVLVLALSSSTEDDKKKDGRECMKDYLLALDIETALRNGSPTVDIEIKKVSELQQRVAGGTWNRFIVGQVYTLLETPKTAEKPQTDE